VRWAAVYLDLLLLKRLQLCDKRQRNRLVDTPPSEGAHTLAKPKHEQSRAEQQALIACLRARTAANFRQALLKLVQLVL
jgi:hypothetical protein